MMTFLIRNIGVMATNLTITFNDETIDRYMIVIKIDIISAQSLNIRSKVVAGINEMPMMIIALQASPTIGDPMEMDIGSILELLYKEYAFFRPSDVISYFDQDCEEEIIVERQYISTAKIANDVISLRETDFKITDFLIKIDLDEI